jgi:general secretion pathway protein D
MESSMNMNAHKYIAVAAMMTLAALTATAQPQFGFGQFGQQNTAARSSTTTYPKSTDIGQARITYDPETRSLIIVSDDDTAEHIKSIVTQLDRPTPQVLINCVFLEATYTKGLDLGVEGTYKHTISGSGVDAINTPAGQQNIAKTIFGAAATGGAYTLIGKDLNVTLTALAQAGKTEILSRPSVLARNNQQAVITIGQQVPLITSVNYDNFGNQRNAVDYQDVGIILQVTPFITSDDMVEMVIAPSISQVSDSSVNIAGSTNSPVLAPIINVRSADTVVVTPDRQTVVIGGLMQNTKLKTDSKVPLLGDIPLLGYLFKRTQSTDAKTELLIFLTPSIVKNPRDLAMMSENEKARTKDSKKAFSEEELNRYLHELPGSQPQAAPVPDAAPRSSSSKSTPPPQTGRMVR